VVSLVALALPWPTFASDVPNTIEEAFAFLSKLLPPSEVAAFKQLPEQEASVVSYMGVGMYIRNEWFRSGRSALPAQLQALGAQHIDDMSSMVLTSYWRHLNGKPLKLEAQGNCFRKWWQEQNRLIGEAKTKGSSAHGTPRFSCPGG